MIQCNTVALFQVGKDHETRLSSTSKVSFIFSKHNSYKVIVPTAEGMLGSSQAFAQHVQGLALHPTNKNMAPCSIRLHSSNCSQCFLQPPQSTSPRQLHESLDSGSTLMLHPQILFSGILLISKVFILYYSEEFKKGSLILGLFKSRQHNSVYSLLV